MVTADGSCRNLIHPPKSITPHSRDSAGAFGDIFEDRCSLVVLEHIRTHHLDLFNKSLSPLLEFLILIPQSKFGHPHFLISESCLNFQKILLHDARVSFL